MNSFNTDIVKIARAFDAEIPEDFPREAPVVVNTLQKALLQRLDGVDFDSVVVWNDVDSALLGFTIANETNSQFVIAHSDEGRLSLNMPLSHDARVLLLDTAWDVHPGLSSLLTMIGDDATIVAVAAVTKTAALDAAIEGGYTVVVLED
ncbi:MAG: hypothetical protein SOW59_08780 [Corynebacterium sp.]|nr:hypothetical protein [Corynebacterium sp.]